MNRKVDSERKELNIPYLKDSMWRAEKGKSLISFPFLFDMYEKPKRIFECFPRLGAAATCE